jgi:hypothetical protein
MTRNGRRKEEVLLGSENTRYPACSNTPDEKQARNPERESRGRLKTRLASEGQNDVRDSQAQIKRKNLYSDLVLATKYQ